MENLPSFPVGYMWLIQRELVGYDAFTQLQPWHFVQLEQSFWATERWPGVINVRLFVFARRQDNDDLACFAVDERGVARQVFLIQGWTEAGFDIVREFPDFWEWLKSVVDDISEWTSLDNTIR